MGEGGYLWLINSTPHDFVRGNVRSYQMDSWNKSFPAQVQAGQSARVYVEWCEKVFKNHKDDAGEAVFSLANTPWSFEVQARASSGYALQVCLTKMSTQNNPQGSVISLGWVHDGEVFFILTGASGNFISNNPPSAWMQSNLSTIGSRPLRHLCMPGSHDSGMSKLTGGTAFVTADNCVTQQVGVGPQLTLGARYFDMRPVITGGKYATGHYSHIDVLDLGWQGGNGQDFTEIIAEINTFTASNAELVVLNLSHDRNTDVGRDYRAFTQNEWNILMQQLLSLNYLFVAPDPANVDLTTLTLNQFIGGNQAAVVIIVQPDDGSVYLGDYSNRGFYRYAQYNAWNRYADTNDRDKMVNDQLTKMAQQRTSHCRAGNGPG